MGRVALALPRPSSPTLIAWYISAEPTTPSSAPHWPRCTCQGWRPPGVALLMFSEKSVFSLFLAGCIVAEPLICTAPTRAAGVTSEACQREFTFASRVTSVTGSRRNGLQATSASVEAASNSILGLGMHPPGGPVGNHWSKIADAASGHVPLPY